MNNKRSITLALCWILVTISGLCVLSFAGNESGTNPEAEQHFEKANELRKAANYDAAITEYKKVMSLSSNSKIAQDAQYWIGQSHFEAGQFDDALSAFQKLLDEYPASTIIPSTKLMMERVRQAKEEKSLIEAVEKGDIEQLKLLISEGADVNNVKDPNGLTLLHLAAKQGHADITALLINKRAVVNARDEHTYSKTPLHWAALKGHAAVAELLIARGADVSIRGTYGHTPLEYAAHRGHFDVVELLLSKGADVEAADNWNVTPLFAAVRGNHPEIVKLLIDRGANNEVRLKTNRGTPLHKAVTDNNLEMATLLLKAGAYVDVRDGQDWTPLHRAVVQGNQDMAELLLAHGAWLTRRRFGQSLVMLAMYGNQKEMVKFLIDKGIRRWHSPVHLAAFFGGLNEVKSYLAAGGDIDAQGSFDQLTLLMCAMYGEQTDVIEFLISKGADLNLQDCQGLTALHRAVADLPEIARLLLDKGADVTIRSDFGATPLTRAVFFSDVEMLKMLIAQGVDVNIRFGFTGTGDIGSTVLHRACRTGDKAKAEVLIAHSADVNAKNRDGHTPMSLAKRSGNEQLVELLRKHGAKE